MALSLKHSRKRKIMKLLSIILVSIALVGCGTTKNNETTDVTKPERNYMMKAKIGEFGESAPFEIHDVRVEGNLMFVNITFEGGCGVHKFKMIGSPMTMKSMPAKRSVQISREIEREECKDTVKKILEIDISELADSQTSGSEIYLLLDGWDKEIHYTFE